MKTFSRKMQLLMFTMMLSLVVTLLIAPSAAHAFSGGDGTSGNPYQIANCLDLQEVDTNDPGNAALYYVVTQDIDCSDTVNWNGGEGFTPIGLNTDFRGHFDGGGYEISDIYINLDDYGVGLFGHVYEAIISDVHIRDITVIGFEGAEYYGALIGYNEDGVISDSSATGSVSGAYATGGLIGENYGPITGSWTDVTVTDIDGGTAGGLVGTHNNGDIEDSYALGDVNGLAEAGGLVGENDGTISQSFATGNVTSQGSYAGGFVGDNGDDITQSFATGNVTGDDNVGGFVGSTSGDIIDAYSRGNVTADDDAGGFEGYSDSGTTVHAYDTAVTIIGDTEDGDVGAFMGEDDSYTHDSNFWDDQITNTHTDEGDATPKTTAEMKTETTFTDTVNSTGLLTAWDFSEVWVIDEHNDGYPHFQWAEDYFQSLEPEVPVDDSDNVPAEIENAAPNGGDGNGDGTPDSAQSEVASFVNSVTGKYATLQVNNECDVVSVTNAHETANTSQDIAFSYPAGMMNFTVSCATPGFSATVKIIYHDLDNAGYVLRKYHPTTRAYFSLPAMAIAATTIGSTPAIYATYALVDGGLYDVDGTANGTIIDPAGLGIAAIGAPQTGLGGTA